MPIFERVGDRLTAMQSIRPRPDLIEFGLIRGGEPVEFRRTKDGPVFRATIAADGQVITENGAAFDSLSRAAAELSGLTAIPGWDIWTAPERQGRRLAEIRAEFLAAVGERS